MKSQRSQKLVNIAGFTLLEGMIMIGILSIAGMALVGMNVNIMKSNKSASLRSDLQDIKRTITNLISCDQTLGDDRPTTCTGPVTLKDKKGSSLVNSSGKIGDWNIEATCESLGTPSTPGLSIYATKPDKIDPIRNLPLDKNHPISALFNPDVRLCGENFRDSPGGKVEPLYGNYTPFFVGASAVNSALRKGIEIGWNANYDAATDRWSSVDAQYNWDICKNSFPSAEVNPIMTNSGCQQRICQGFFKKRYNPINFSPNGWCGKTPRGPGGVIIQNNCSKKYGVDQPAISIGCMWTKESFEAGKVE